MPASQEKHNPSLCLVVIAVLVLALPLSAQASPASVPPPTYNPPDSTNTEQATLSGGCFWGMQGVYEHVKGVEHVYAGYTGGSAATAKYETVSTGTTGNAESVQITFNPQMVVIGGGVSEIGEAIIAPARETVQTYAMSPNRDEVQIVAAKLGNEAGLYGAAYLPWES